MPPEPSVTPPPITIRPEPAPTESRSQAPLAGLLILLFVLLLGAYAWFSYMGGGAEGRVTLLVRAVDGTRTLSELDLKTGALAPQGDAGAQAPRQQVLMDDGTTIMLDTPGIVSQYESEQATTRVLVASPTPPLPQTPLAVWGQGERVAWVNPADGALQVFEWNGSAYAPLHVFDAAPQSIGFATKDFLVGAAFKDSKTVISIYDLRRGTSKESITLDGVISIVTP